MILNEWQYNITKAEMKKFELAIAQMISKPVPEDENDQICHEAYLESLQSQIEEFTEDIKEYENLKNNQGKIERLQYDNLEKLPEALIKARIIRGHTQESFAKLLGVKPQQLQRDEANGYASASLTKLLKIQKTLNLEIREEIIFK
ncbi:helix-turn-helix transcriptional regulator [Trichormus sp. NMC-1]|uniref:helix-turn-helix transcriptional regulator n=1 Tax=Trichormus sp. NMC-1 TaxID=1853259 RepID=UPI0008DBED66|nr:helix-turn-helix transcriptional regulator [Trichormus sp. NMC-1]